MSITTLLAGGVGGARLARGLAAVLPKENLTVVVNVGDDDRIYGAHVSADLDTVAYTLAGIVGPHGWGVDGDTFTVMDAMSEFGEDTSFRLGDRDLAWCLARTSRLDAGEPLSSITADLTASIAVPARLLPASDDPVRTRLRTPHGWLDFQDYFVRRRHQDNVEEVTYEGATKARPAPGVIDAITAADRLIIGPSNPPLSIHPILAIPEIAAAVRSRDRVFAVSPLFSGRALKGPADRVLTSLGFPPGNAGVAAAYDGFITDLVVDEADEADVGVLSSDLTVHITSTRFVEPEPAARFATWLLDRP